MTTASKTPPAVDLKLEVTVIPVSDVDRAKRFYEFSRLAARRRFPQGRRVSRRSIHASGLADVDPPRPW